jgi:hypothetical protein
MLFWYNLSMAFYFILSFLLVLFWLLLDKKLCLGWLTKVSLFIGEGLHFCLWTNRFWKNLHNGWQTLPP